MWVQSANKKSLFDATRFEIQKNIGGNSDRKYAIIAFGGSRSIDGGTVLGYYSNKESAVAQLEKIKKVIIENPAALNTSCFNF